MSKFDSYGVLIDLYKPPIFKGDKVEYITSESRLNDKKQSLSFKYPLIGIWDGEKVEFFDKKEHIVRTTKWLNKV